MLTTLTIKNYALIEELEVTFDRGLNIITGETGAGKSIVIDAVSLILGERAETEAVRTGTEKAIVEGIFKVTGNKKLKALLHENEIEWQEEMIARREVSAKGQSRSFINDSPVTTGFLKQVGDLLVDLHGQHEHQSLLRPDTHIDLLDDFGGLDGLVAEFSGAYRNVTVVIDELNELTAKEHELMERQVLYEFQVNEIDAVSPVEGEEDRLETELKILENSERLHAATERLYQMLYEGENAVHDQLVLLRNELESLAAIDKEFDEPKNEASSAAAIVSELARFIQGYNSKIEFNPERLEEIRNRLGGLTLLKKKYGGSLESLIRHREKIGKELELANNFQAEIASLQKRLDSERKKASDIAQRLSAKRIEISKKVNRAIVQALATLGIPNAEFETEIKQTRVAEESNAVVKLGKEYYRATPDGMDTVEFYVSTNAGEEPKPIVKVASGGEISRIMLALKMTLAKSDRLPLLIFDEIDVGVSGRIAQAVGQCMKKLAQFHQVVAITHLPQIAGQADTHYVVEKVEKGKRSFTGMRKLSDEERVTEVAKLMSGAEVTERGRETARELMAAVSKQ
ncbi:MAG TPA: DNA repair protein RecN [Bacteroidota bacterium]|nr:DNA repair protein RecN [Bacteroidota bacterium]